MKKAVRLTLGTLSMALIFFVSFGVSQSQIVEAGVAGESYTVYITEDEVENMYEYKYSNTKSLISYVGSVASSLPISGDLSSDNLRAIDEAYYDNTGIVATYTYGITMSLNTLEFEPA
ncbi:hypothetical protein N781_18320 [Pontibacillus halophilus JSM 076056 = DSM 19796]|uniref:Uncharacterized protein n=1 Tax=Pontibacillus halophilus JSM 076056 = DSM 19796 TaxID=1385510 RepID=A0A0A5GMA0_9BACI|nr:hypothetical protein [Pontibacillus halophilus]KGX92295.1 hypothetical protein N781_18320 [Pontibacillus halophilus JSM 076056 = DSM 19796]